MKKRTLATLLMLVSTMIWGSAFVAQSVGAQHIGPFTFGAIRFFLGGLVLLPVLRLTRKRTAAPSSPAVPLRSYWLGGSICGLMVFLGALFQQIGIVNTTVGKSGFVTALYVVMVPIFAFFVYRRRLHLPVIIAIGLALLGVYLLCINENFSINKGDIYNLIGAVFWAAQILCIEKFSRNANGLLFAFYEFMACAFFNGILMVLFERPSLASLQAAALPLLYTGILSVGVGFTAQVLCLQYIDPTIASLLMSLEAVFSVIFGFLLLGETLTLQQGMGAALMFGGVLLAQKPPKGAKPVVPQP